MDDLPLSGSSAAPGNLIEASAWEQDKENLRPLRGGRNAATLAHLYHAPVGQEASAELVARKAALEAERAQLAADLEHRLEAAKASLAASWTNRGPAVSHLVGLWCECVNFLAEWFPADASQEQQLLEQATTSLAEEPACREDWRYLQLWLRLADLVKEPAELYSFLWTREIGSTFAAFYESWAQYLELQNRTSEAFEVLRVGLARNAQPLHRLRACQDSLRAREEKRNAALDIFGDSQPLAPLSSGPPSSRTRFGIFSDARQSQQQQQQQEQPQPQPHQHQQQQQQRQPFAPQRTALNRISELEALQFHRPLQPRGDSARAVRLGSIEGFTSSAPRGQLQCFDESMGGVHFEGAPPSFGLGNHAPGTGMRASVLDAGSGMDHSFPPHPSSGLHSSFSSFSSSYYSSAFTSAATATTARATRTATATAAEPAAATAPTPPPPPPPPPPPTTLLSAAAAAAAASTGRAPSIFDVRSQWAKPPRSADEAQKENLRSSSGDVSFTDFSRLARRGDGSYGRRGGGQSRRAPTQISIFVEEEFSAQPQQQLEQQQDFLLQQQQQQEHLRDVERHQALLLQQQQQQRQHSLQQEQLRAKANFRNVLQELQSRPRALETESEVKMEIHVQQQQQQAQEEQRNLFPCSSTSPLGVSSASSGDLQDLADVKKVLSASRPGRVLQRYTSDITEDPSTPPSTTRRRLPNSADRFGPAGELLDGGNDLVVMDGGAASLRTTGGAGQLAPHLIVSSAAPWRAPGAPIRHGGRRRRTIQDAEVDAAAAEAAALVADMAALRLREEPPPKRHCLSRSTASASRRAGTRRCLFRGSSTSPYSPSTPLTGSGRRGMRPVCGLIGSSPKSPMSIVRDEAVREGGSSALVPGVPAWNCSRMLIFED